MRVVGLPQFTNRTEVCLIDGELYFLLRPNTISVYAVSGFDRQTLTFQRVRTVPEAAARPLDMDDMVAIDGYLYVDATEQPSVYRIDPHSGKTTVVVARFDASFYRLQNHVRNLTIAGGLDVYELSGDDYGSNFVRYESLQVALGDVYRLPSETMASYYLLACDTFVYRERALARDAGGCLFHLDGDGRLRLYGPDLRQVRELGTLSLGVGDMAGHVMVRMWFDENRGLLYLWVIKMTSRLLVFSLTYTS